MMSEGGEARCSDCGKTPKTCWLPPHLCKHPDREGGEARKHKAEVEAVLSAVGSPECNCRSKAEAALDAVRYAPERRCKRCTCGNPERCPRV